MGDLLPLLLLATVALWAAAMFDCVTTDERLIRQFPKSVWILVIMLLPGVGGVTWFVAGRAKPTAIPHHIASGHPAGRGRIEATEPVEPPPAHRLAPDDDPDFLAHIAEQVRRMEPGLSATGGRADEPNAADPREERLRQWEADLRQREERLRQRGEPPIES